VEALCELFCAVRDQDLDKAQTALASAPKVMEKFRGAAVSLGLISEYPAGSRVRDVLRGDKGTVRPEGACGDPGGDDSEEDNPLFVCVAWDGMAEWICCIDASEIELVQL